MKKHLNEIDTIIYLSKSGALELKTDEEREAIWLSKAKRLLFDVQKRQFPSIK